MPGVIASGISRLPIKGVFEQSEMLLARVLSARSMTREFIKSFREVVELVDVFHIQSQWIGEVLRSNGVPDEKIAFVEMGVTQIPLRREYKSAELFNEVRPLRLVFAGRCIDVKGIETIVEALEYLDQSAPLRISLLGPGWDSKYGERLRNRVRGDRRVLPPKVVETEEILYELAQHDACLVPSFCLETGPLVAYEAMAAGIPIIGSRLGGIAERVRDNVEGLLFPPGDARALAGLINGILQSPEKLNWLQKNIRPQRTFDEMARELDLLYQPITVCPENLECGVKSEPKEAMES
jgi:glycosyltransferase involved in cell wall biosynthesis